MNKKTFLLTAGALALMLSPVNAQEADRFVGAQHVKFQTACHPEDVKHYDTKLLRERFVMEKVMSPDSILSPIPTTTASSSAVPCPSTRR